MMLDVIAIETAVVLFVVFTIALWLFGNWYNSKVVEGKIGDTRPTSDLVVGGVAGTEIIRAIRFAVIATAIWGYWAGALVLGLWAVESLLAWIPVGLPIICGESHRAKRRKEQAEAPVREQMRVLADEARQRQA